MADIEEDVFTSDDGDFYFIEEGPKRRKRRTKQEKEAEGYYISPKEFQEELEKYYSTNDFNNKLGDMIRRIAVNLSFAPNFINYTYKDEMVGDAIEKMARAIIRKTYKLDSGSNPFNYFTTIAMNSFRNRLSKEKKIKSVQEEYKERMFPELLDDQCTEGVYLKNSRQVNDDD